MHKKKIVPPEDQLFHFLDDSMVKTWSVMANLGMCVAGDLFCTFTQCYQHHLLSAIISLCISLTPTTTTLMGNYSSELMRVIHRRSAT